VPQDPTANWGTIRRESPAGGLGSPAGTLADPCLETWVVVPPFPVRKKHCARINTGLRN
jgi:hypothetical protein